MCYRVLFVDDEQAVLHGLYRNLSIHLDITTAYSASEGLHLLGGPGDFDAVVTDLNMPKMGGMEFVEKAKQLVPGTPFIVLSGTCDFEALEEAQANRVVAQVIAKPATSSVLLEAIHNAILDSSVLT